jgi:hypothetical protein
MIIPIILLTVSAILFILDYLNTDANTDYMSMSFVCFMGGMLALVFVHLS